MLQKVILGKSWTIKTVILAVAGLAFFIPLAMVQEMISERSQRANEVREEIANSWVPVESIVGTPVMYIPYLRYEPAPNPSNLQPPPETTTMEAFKVIPAQVETQAAVSVHPRSRGIFKANTFNSRLQMKGALKATGLDTFYKSTKIKILWDESYIAVPIGQRKAARGNLEFVLAGKKVESSLSRDSVTASFFKIPLPDLDQGLLAAGIPFTAAFDGAGTDHFTIRPDALSYKLVVTSNWGSPSFADTLPDFHDISKSGFTAQWSQNSAGSLAETVQRMTAPDKAGWGTVAAPAFDTIKVRMVDPVDPYQQAMRAAKYGILFVLIGFITLFIFELLAGISLHVLNYLQIGLANVIFFFLLFSLSEHIPFQVSYAAAAAAVACQIFLYAKVILRGTGRAVILSSTLIVSYVLMYALLIEESYAMLIGSIALFLSLCVVMYITRRIDFSRMDPLGRSLMPATGELSGESHAREGR